MEDDVGELPRLLLERDLEVLLPEELRVGQPGGEDAFVAGDDRGAAVGRVDIGGADEIGGQRPLPVHAGEIFLVGAHGELDHLARDLEEGGVEASEQGHRPFGQAGILGDEAIVLDQGQAGGGGGGAGAFGDEAAALGRVDDDMAGLELLEIIVGAADGDRAGMVEPVAEGGGAAPHPRDLDVDGDGIAAVTLAEQGDDALQRPDPARALGRGGGGAPAHRPGPGEGADDGGYGFGEHGRGGPAGLLDDREEDAIALLELVAGEAGLAKEAFERLRRGGRAWALGFLADRFGLGLEAAGDEHQAARRGVGIDRFGGEART